VLGAAVAAVPASAQRASSKRTQAHTRTAAATALPSDVGQWGPVLTWPLVAVHSVLQPSGNVLVWDGFGNGPNSQRLWDPATGTFTAVPNASNLFCGGQLALADGRTIVVGGHVSPNNGLTETNLFNPSTNSWTRGADMSKARWYPTGTTLPDGRVLVVSGDSIVQDNTPPITPLSIHSNDTPEIYNPRLNSWTSLPTAARALPLYPFMFVLPDGRVLDAGPEQQSRTLDVATGTWSPLALSPIDGHSAVMYRPGKVLKTGKWTDPDYKDLVVHGRAAVLDTTVSVPAWREVAPMSFPRSYHTLVALPDGNVLAVGGDSTSEGTILANGVLSPEIWNPATETWSTMAPMQTPRLYHSTALLLPDARVLVAGGGALPASAIDQDSAEVYSPPYLFRGARPSITSAPSTVQYTSTFSVSTPDAARIASVALVRTPAVTHAFDQNQRYVPLTFTATSGGLDVTAPANGNVAPPGYYMLFVVDTNGVPSVASFVRLPAAWEDQVAPSAPSGLSAMGGLGSAGLLWTAAVDNVAVTGYDIHRSTTPGFTPSAANRVGQTTLTTFTDTGLAPGTYYYVVVAHDAAGNSSPPSNVAFATASADNTGSVGLVAAYSFDADAGTTVPDISGSGNVGTISGAVWTAAGRVDGALSFGGLRDWVTVPDAPSLDLTDGMTLEAWVRPVALGGIWRTVLIKEQPADLVYGLYAGTNTSVPDAVTFTNGAEQQAAGSAQLPLNAWSHLAATYDGATVRLYVNGALVSSSSVSGSMPNSDGPLRIGGNAVWGEYFDGLIDELRVYNRALSATEIQGDMNTPVTPPPPPADSTPPTAPAGLSATGSLRTVSLVWNASSDDVGVAHYNVHRSTTPGFTPSAANRVAQPSGSSYTDAGLSPGIYFYRVTAVDAAGNVSPPSTEASGNAADTTAPTAPGALSATGSVGAVSLTWSASNDDVGVAHYNVYRSTTAPFVPDASTLIAQPTGTSYTDDALTPGVYHYLVSAADAAGNVSALSAEASGIAAADTSPPTAPAGLSARGSLGVVRLAWSASTDDVGVVRYNVHRSTAPDFVPVEANRVAQPTGTSYTDAALVPGVYYYRVTAEDAAANVSAASAEATGDSSTDSLAPEAPTGVAATGSLGTVSLTWNASADDVGVVRYNVHRSTTPGFVPDPGTVIAQPTGASYTDSGLIPATYYYRVTAEDAAGNLSAPSAQATGIAGDISAPVVALLSPAVGSTVVGTFAVSASASDNVSVTGVQFKLDGVNLGAEDTTVPYSVTWDTRQSPDGTHRLTAVARDAAGNQSTSAPVDVTVDNLKGLVAAYSFDAGSGTIADDVSGNGNRGTISGATWSSTGKFGRSLLFDTAALVSVADAASLDLTGAMTIEAWVRPSSTTQFRPVAVKENSSAIVYGLYANSRSGGGDDSPSAHALLGGTEVVARAQNRIAQDSWTHVAATYDGTAVRLYVNGSLAASRSAGGSISTSSGPLRIGGNVVRGESYRGLIDELRIYRRALTATEIRTDMNVPVGP
jgi:fibronectin type 3 domain-containing protein